MHRIKNFLLSVLVAGASIALALLIGEGLLHLTPYNKLLPYQGIPEHYYTESKDAGYDISKNFATSTHRFADATYPLWSNNIGCFDYNAEAKPPYIYLGGDSFTWGFTPFEDKWGVILETSLKERVLKCGVPGYGTKQELIKAKKTLEGMPDPSLILVGYFANDPGDDAAFPNSLVYKGRLIKNLSGDPTLTYEELESRLPQFAQWAEEYCMWNMPAHPALQRVKCYLRNHSIVYLLAQSTVKSLVSKDMLQAIGIVNQEPKPAPVDDSALDAHYEAILGFAALAEQKHAPLVFVFVPSEEDVYSTGETSAYSKEKAFMDEHKISYIDPLPQFREAAAATTAPFYWPHDPHLNSAGNRVLGELVGDYLMQKEFFVAPHQEM